MALGVRAQDGELDALGEFGQAALLRGHVLLAGRLLLVAALLVAARKPRKVMTVPLADNSTRGQVRPGSRVAPTLMVAVEPRASAI